MGIDSLCKKQSQCLEPDAGQGAPLDASHQALDSNPNNGQVDAFAYGSPSLSKTQADASSLNHQALAFGVAPAIKTGEGQAISEAALADLKQHLKNPEVVWAYLVQGFDENARVIEAFNQATLGVGATDHFDVLLPEAKVIQANWTSPWLWEALTLSLEIKVEGLEGEISDLEMIGEEVPAEIRTKLAEFQEQLPDLKALREELESLDLVSPEDLVRLSELVTEVGALQEDWLLTEFKEGLDRLGRRVSGDPRLADLEARLQDLTEDPSLISTLSLGELALAKEYFQNLLVLENHGASDVAQFRATWREWSWGGADIPIALADQLRNQALALVARAKAEQIWLQIEEAQDELDGRFNQMFLKARGVDTDALARAPQTLEEANRGWLKVAEKAEAGDYEGASQIMKGLYGGDFSKATIAVYQASEDDGAKGVAAMAALMCVGAVVGGILRGIVGNGARGYLAGARGGDLFAFAFNMRTVSIVRPGVTGVRAWATTQVPNLAGGLAWGVGFYTGHHGAHSLVSGESFFSEDYNINQKALKLGAEGGLASGLCGVINAAHRVFKYLPAPVKFAATLGLLGSYGAFSQEVSRGMDNVIEGRPYDFSWNEVEANFNYHLGSAEGMARSAALLGAVQFLNYAMPKALRGFGDWVVRGLDRLQARSPETAEAVGSLAFMPFMTVGSVFPRGARPGSAPTEGAEAEGVEAFESQPTQQQPGAKSGGYTRGRAPSRPNEVVKRELDAPRPRRRSYRVGTPPSGGPIPSAPGDAVPVARGPRVSGATLKPAAEAPTGPSDQALTVPSPVAARESSAPKAARPRESGAVPRPIARETTEPGGKEITVPNPSSEVPEPLDTAPTEARPAAKNGKEVMLSPEEIREVPPPPSSEAMKLVDGFMNRVRAAAERLVGPTAAKTSETSAPRASETGQVRAVRQAIRTIRGCYEQTQRGLQQKLEGRQEAGQNSEGLKAKAERAQSLLNKMAEGKTLSEGEVRFLSALGRVLRVNFNPLSSQNFLDALSGKIGQLEGQLETVNKNLEGLKELETELDTLSGSEGGAQPSQLQDMVGRLESYTQEGGPLNESRAGEAHEAWAEAKAEVGGVIGAEPVADEVMELEPDELIFD